MVDLIIDNFKEVEDSARENLTSLIEEKLDFYTNLFKNYDKDLIIRIIFDHSSSVYKITASINMKSKKIILVEENKDVIKAFTSLMSKFKTVVKKQYELEKKEYEYKRKR